MLSAMKSKNPGNSSPSVASRVVSQHGWVILQVATLVTVVSLLPGVDARGYDPESCCMQAYLLNRSRTELPWNVCLPKYRNATDVYPVITATLGWCKANCGSGSSFNKRLEWLPPLTTWIFPMLVLLANLPVGDLPQRFIKDFAVLEYLSLLWPYVEWISVLGDPASAFCAAYSTLVKDFLLSWALLRNRSGSRKLQPLDKSLIGLAMVASRTRPEEYSLAAFLPAGFSRLISEFLMNPEVAAGHELRDSLFSLKNVFDNRNIKIEMGFGDARKMLNAFEVSDTKGVTLRQELRTLEELLQSTPQTPATESPGAVIGKQADTLSLTSFEEVPDLLGAVKSSNAIWADHPEGRATDEKREIQPVGEENGQPPIEPPVERILPSTTIKFVIQAIRRSRENFLISIAFPMVIVFANLINTFASAYKQLGNEDTAQGIAYGTWYMWILILAVSSNTTASSAKTLYVSDALRTGAGIRPRQIFVESVMSRNAYGNNANWFRWLEDAEVPKLHRIGILGPGDPNRFHFLWYIIWQTAGWVWVGFACANAAAVAFTTPTVGLGCRSFNHVLYASGTFAAAWFRVFKRETFERRDAYPGKEQSDKSISARAQLVFGTLYHVICTLNVLILSLGTLFQISGLYNNCKCQALFGDDNSIIDISAPTTKSRDNAARYWLSMAYVAYTTAWIACGLAICARAFIFWILDREFGDEEDIEEE
ncbi:hypothetical protein ABW19_dt0202851 [Dactylella cylindrospora]|nr:hypothetical protein ABW19_dt0202851 [Dactylella cylindrospora]